MIYKIAFKVFRNSLKNNIFYFIANSVGVAEFFVFWGLNSIITEIMTSGITGENAIYDSVIALGAIIIFTTTLMVYSILNYMKLRIKNYSLFVIIGMRKRKMYAMILTEYLTGWLISLILGLVAGAGILQAVLTTWHNTFPEYVGMAQIGISVYGMTCKVNLGIMAATLFILRIWIDNHDLSGLTSGDDVKESRPQNSHWKVMILIGIILFAIGIFQYSGSVTQGWPYVFSHFSWITGGFLMVSFGGGYCWSGCIEEEIFI